MNMNLFQLLFCICYVGLSVVTCTRKVTLIRDYNGACINIPSVEKATSFKLIFDKEVEGWERSMVRKISIPVIIFNYLDLNRIKDLPDADEFFEKKEDLKLHFSLVSMKNLEPYINLNYEDEKLIHPIIAEIIDITDNPRYINYSIKEPGVYCIYILSVFSELDSTSFLNGLKNYQLTVEVNEEKYMLREKCEIEIISKFALVMGCFLISIVYYNVFKVQPTNIYKRNSNIVVELMKATRDSKHTPIIIKHLIYLISLIVVLDVLFLGLLIVRTAFPEISAIDKTTHFIIPVFRMIILTFFDYSLYWFIFLIFLGHGIIYDFRLNDSSNQYKPPSNILTYSNFIPLLGILDMICGGRPPKWKTYFDDSVILNKGYLSDYLIMDIGILFLVSLNFIFQCVVFILNVHYNIKTYSKLKSGSKKGSAKCENNKLKNFLIFSIYWYSKFVLNGFWAVVVHKAYNPPIDFTKNIGAELTYKSDLCLAYGYRMLNIFFIWLIWGMKPAGLREIDVSESHTETTSGKAIMLE